MKKTLFIVFLVFTNVISSQNSQGNCIELKTGTFDSLENEKKQGTIYRKGDFQIEKYIGKKKLRIIKFNSNKCKFIFKSHKIISDIDTITWKVNYIKYKPRHYKFVVRPAYLNINFKLEGEVIKISDNIVDKEALDLFNKLATKND